MIGRVKESRNLKKVIRVSLMESYGEIGRVPVNLIQNVYNGSAKCSRESLGSKDVCLTGI